MKKTFLLILFLTNTILAQQKTLILSKTQLKDKIKGGWAGQTIGVTFGGPLSLNTTALSSMNISLYNGMMAI
jgi:hypothetical protein